MPDPQEGKPDASSALPRGSEEPDGAPSLNESDKYAADRRLPVVVVPRLDGGDAVMPPAVEAFVENVAGESERGSRCVVCGRGRSG